MAEQAGPEHGRWLLSLRPLAQAWVLANASPMHNATAQTPAYANLIFAFGLARLGEADDAREALARANTVLSAPGCDEAHHWLLAAFTYRVQQALRGGQHTGQLPRSLIEELEIMERLRRYAVDRMRKHSRILEHQALNPFRPWGARLNDFERALSDLSHSMDGAEVIRLTDHLMNSLPKGAKGEEARARLVKAGLDAAPRVGANDLGRRMLDEALSAYDALPVAQDDASLGEQASFLEKALFVAGYFGLSESVPPLMDRTRCLLRALGGSLALVWLVRQSVRTFVRLRMAEELDQFLQECKDLVLQGHDVSSLNFRTSPLELYRLRSLLCLCEGWFLFGWDRLARPVVEVARGLLLRGDLPAREQAELACAYLAAAGLAPTAEARNRIEEMFRQLPGIRDTYTTSTHFSVSQLDVVEAAVLAYAERADLVLP